MDTAKQTFWVFFLIDIDLAHDDMDSAALAMPQTLYRTRGQAFAAMQQLFRTMMEPYFSMDEPSTEQEKRDLGRHCKRFLRHTRNACSGARGRKSGTFDDMVTWGLYPISTDGGK